MMRNKGGINAIYAYEKIFRVANENKQILSLAGYLAMGAVMACTNLFGGISPFGVAFCASLDPGNAIVASLGTIIGYIISSERQSNMQYIAAILLVASAKWLFGSNRIGVFGKNSRNIKGAAAAVITSLFALLVAGAAIAFSSDYTLYDLTLHLAEILLACGATYFFFRARVAVNVGWANTSKSDISCVIISLATIAMGLSGIVISSLSLGRIACVVAILLCARAAGEPGGSVAGVTAGIAMGLAGGDISYVVSAYAFGGLVSGVFAGMGRLACASAFIIVNAVVAFLTQDSVSVYSSLVETFVASVVFIAIPPALVNRLRPVGKSAQQSGAYLRGILQDKLADVSAAFLQIGEKTRKVSDGLEKIDGSEQVDFAGKAVDRVCRKCNMKNTCWQFSYSETARAMNTAAGVVRRTGSISRSKAPKYLAQNCDRLDEMLAELNTQFQIFASKEAVSKKIAQVRMIVADQFEGISTILNEISQDVLSPKYFDEQKAARVKEYFDKEGVSTSRIAAYTDDADRLSISFVIPNYQLARLHRTKSTLDLCGILETDFDPPKTMARNQKVMVAYTEKTIFKVEFASYQIPESGNKLCGDTYEYIENQNGRTHLVLSDGMGSGGAAAVDSTMASGLISCMLETGIGHDAALKAVNSALIVKSGEESLATLDVATIDLYTGRADFYKAGAAPTFLVKNTKASLIESASLPAGILRGVAFEHTVAALKENDLIVMVSDGVTAQGADWVKPELEGMCMASVQSICEKLAMTAKARRKDNHEDDITVLAALITQAG